MNQLNRQEEHDANKLSHLTELGIFKAIFLVFLKFDTAFRT